MNNNKGWWEAKNPLSDKAPVHQAVAAKQAFNKDFGNKRVSIKPKQNVILHFSMSDAEMDKFTDIVLVQFRKEFGFVDITVSRDDDNKTVVELPRDKAILFHDYILGKNSKFGTTDINDLNELIKLQEDSLEKIPIQDIDTRLRVLR